MIRHGENDSTMIYNEIFDLGLSLVEFRLYMHLLIRADDNGNVFEKSEDISKICNMSMGSVSNAKRNLANRGLISITNVPGSKGRPTHVINILNDQGGKYGKRIRL